MYQFRFNLITQRLHPNMSNKPLTENEVFLYNPDDVSKVRQALKLGCPLWLEEGELQIGSEPPSQAHIWNKETKEWVLNETKANELYTHNLECIKNKKREFINNYLDKKAQEYGYNSIVNAITYANEPTVPKFQKEGLAFRAWRSLVWAKGYEIIEEVSTGKRSIPTDEELIELLPKFKVNYED